jgi:CRISPR/Cas system endoribonuclease Cas6 (RAMP superfamily)
MRNVRYRIVASPGWECSFTLEFDKTVVSREQMGAVLLDAGKLVGIGNGRKIGMGRFEVVSVEFSD